MSESLVLAIIVGVTLFLAKFFLIDENGSHISGVEDSKDKQKRRDEERTRVIKIWATVVTVTIGAYVVSIQF